MDQHYLVEYLMVNLLFFYTKKYILNTFYDLSTNDLNKIYIIFDDVETFKKTNLK